jgi:hypothetical protein
MAMPGARFRVKISVSVESRADVLAALEALLEGDCAVAQPSMRGSMRKRYIENWVKVILSEAKDPFEPPGSFVATLLRMTVYVKLVLNG